MKRTLMIFLGFFSFVASAQSYKGAERSFNLSQELNDLYCSGLFQSTDGTIIEVANNMGTRAYMNILDWLEGRVAGLQVYKSRNGAGIPVIRGGVPGIYVDEMPVPADYFNSLNTADIAIIKVIRTPFFGGFNGGNGAIAIYTLGGEEEDAEHSN
jgi:hypothetical protein